VDGKRRPDLDTLFSINADGSRNAIHPADVRGRFQRRKNVLWTVLVAIYLVLPWLEVDGRPALLFDIEARHFYLFGNTFNAQDFWFAFFLVSGLGFTLFVVAALWGRVWCGYACPQTVFLEGVFRRIERWIEGPAARRQKMDHAPFAQRAPRRLAKLFVYLLLSAVIAHSFLGYFMPVDVIVAAVTESPGKHPTAFGFVVVATLVLFVNFTWFREQLCIVVCPYGRLQGALYDQDTVVVGYDRTRGEPRGAVGTDGAGACVDCFRCVVVCPTGIDIRNGTQMECVGCANCIDACDDVMAKLGRAAGLVRYDSQAGFEGGRRRFWRGRVALYAVLLLIGATVATLAVGLRRPFEARLERMRGQSYVLQDGVVRNTFTLQLVNKRPGTRTFVLRAVGPAAAQVTLAEIRVEMESLADRRVPVVFDLPVDRFLAGERAEVHVECLEGDEPLRAVATAPLLGPSGRTR
jgi:cytochrome c oxidase accessory protein FixG